MMNSSAVREVLLESRRNHLSHSWSFLTNASIIKVWECIAALVQRTISVQQRGVNIPGLATFTLTKTSLDVGHNKVLVLQRPLCVMNEKLLRVHQLKGSSIKEGGGDVPVVPLNYTQVALDAQLTRDHVDASIREVVGAISRMIAAKRNVEFPFEGIGCLYIRSGRVKMKFFKGFVNSVDGSGMMVESLQGRPGTADSVMSDGMRPGSKLRFNNDDAMLPIIRELREGLDEDDDEKRDTSPDVLNLENNEFEEFSTSREMLSLDRQHNIFAEDNEKNREFTSRNQEIMNQGLMKENQCDVPMSNNFDAENDDLFNLASIFEECGEDEEDPSDEIQENENEKHRMLSDKIQKLKDWEESQINNDADDGTCHFPDEGFETHRFKSSRSSRFHGSGFIPQTPLTSRSKDLCALSPESIPPFLRSQSSFSLNHSDRRLTPLPLRSRSMMTSFDGSSRASSVLGSEIPDEKLPSLDWSEGKFPGGITPGEVLASEMLLAPHPPPCRRPTSCVHSDTGQGLCYVCYQRARNNIAVSHAEERRRRLEEEDRILHQRQKAHNDAVAAREQELKEERRAEDMRIAEFNFRTGESAAAVKKRKDSIFRPSFVFRRRLVTPPAFIKQENSRRDLEAQIASKIDAETKIKEQKEAAGRLEQTQLAAAVAADREESMRKKAEDREAFRRGLDAQLSSKPPPLPAAFASTPYFGRNDDNAETLRDKQARAQQLLQEHLTTVQQLKREAVLNRLEEQRQEEDMLRRKREQLKQDDLRRYESMLTRRASLENHWVRAAEAKRARDRQERARDRNFCAALVHEQCDQYQRCRQCKRRLENTGTSNVLPNTRIMI